MNRITRGSSGPQRQPLGQIWAVEIQARIYRVVIVEDHALARAGLRTALPTDQQLEVVGEAANGLDGFRVIDEMKPDVAVIDIGLPGIDGIELTRRLRA